MDEDALSNEKIDIDFDMEPETESESNNFVLESEEVEAAEAKVTEQPSLLNTVGDVVEETVAAAGSLIGVDAAANDPAKSVPKTRKKINATAAPTKTRKQRTKKERIHASAKTADDWVKYKILDPRLYDVSPEGDYYTDPLLKSGTRQTTATIQPKIYYPAGEKQLKAAYAEREAKVAEAEDTYSSARKELLEVMKSYHAGVALTSEVVLANMKVAEAEKVRNKYAYNTYDSYYVQPRPSLVSLDFNARYVASSKKNPYNVIRFAIDRFPWQFHYSDTLETVEVAAPILTEEIKEEAAPTRELSSAQIGAIIGKKRALTRPPMPKF